MPNSLTSYLSFLPAEHLAALEEEIEIKDSDLLSNTSLADMAANTVKVNATGAEATPTDIALGASTMLARLAAGNIVAATTAEINTLLATVTLTGAQSIAGVKTFSDNIILSADLDHNGSNIGFYSTDPVSLQTGVAVSAAGVHAALVNLGLITA